ncbi:DNA repair protein RadC [Elizabethkingia argentiflava]|uniref:DNA repair protein RadC n=1 Tax=Elizabethkingia argenteiflava TaxID=2681556 RepID=A0A845PU66_9FLAO|nr:DNA repair protein RadC [Elizabethkingia argenteiflava]NAW51772.1 DNA repair protein RadC [Elizabethkingia argenteiflava]
MNLKFLAEDERPREKFLLKGISTLSDAELLAIIMRSGSKQESAVELARSILASVHYNWHQLSLLSTKDLIKFKGIGEAKAISIAAALEMGRRKALQEIPEKPVIKNSKDVFQILHPYLADLQHEEFWCLYLNQSNKVIHKERLTHGGINESIVDIRILYRIALAHFATAVIIIHNHPSGNIKPSQQDIQITHRIKKAGEFLQVELLDHVIISQNFFFSFKDENIF